MSPNSNNVNNFLENNIGILEMIYKTTQQLFYTNNIKY